MGDKVSMIECLSGDVPVVTPAQVDSDRHVLVATSTLRSTQVQLRDGKAQAIPQEDLIQFETDLRVPRTGVLIVGIGGNNGTTFVAGLLANRMETMWETQVGECKANWYGSIAMTGTTKLGVDCETQKDIYVPVRSMLPMLHPNDILVGGWDISTTSLPDAMRRARVLPLEVQKAVAPQMTSIPVWPGIYDKDFIASNQEFRADHVIKGTKVEQVERLRRDINEWRTANELDQVIVFWSGNTERFSEHLPGVHDTWENLEKAVKEDHTEIAPSLLYAIAAVQEGCAFINGSPQNTFCPALLALAQQKGVYLIGDDLKTGQTKFKSVMAEFLVSTGLKPTSICSYNHLGNNDGLNLSSERQFRSKEITKASVVDDMIASNSILYPSGEKHPDHIIVIKYVPAVGDSKRAIDEYTADIFMNGTQTFVIHNTCEDSLLAVPIILDLIIFTELCARIKISRLHGADKTPVQMHPFLSLLSSFLKAPRVPEQAPVVNAFFSQREALTSFVRAVAGLPPNDYIALPHRESAQ